MPPDFLPTHHRSLRLQNFTAFGDAAFEFVPGINVLVGENGTGKTGALKALLWGTDVREQHGHMVPRYSLLDLFSRDLKTGLIRSGAHQSFVTVNGIRTELFPDDERTSVTTLGALRREFPVFIPALDMMGHTKGYLGLERDFQLDFDRTYGDVVSKLELYTKYYPVAIATSEMARIQDRIGGVVEYDAGDRRFYLVTPKGRIAMPLVAEGIRKFATLHTIWKNGWFRPGTCLFWDEPEASLMDEAVAAILALARGGVQVFLATHSYVILKEIELQATKDDSIRFFSLEPKGNGTVVNPADRLEDLHPNPILAQYERLYNLDLQRTIKGTTLR